MLPARIRRNRDPDQCMSGWELDADLDGRVRSGPGSREPSPAVSAASGFDPSRIVHLRNGRAERHASTLGGGRTWCGKPLFGPSEDLGDGIEGFTSYGDSVAVTLDPKSGTCAYCRQRFDAAYNAAFPGGPKPIATFHLNRPGDLERAKAVLSPEALNKFFGPGGGGIAAFDAALSDSDGSTEPGALHGGCE